MNSKLDNFREQIENVIALAFWLGVVGYITATFWLNVRIPDADFPAYGIRIPAETYATPFLLWWTAWERAASNVNPSGWLQSFWLFLDRWKGLMLAGFVLVTLTLAVEKSDVSYSMILIGILGYALYDAYDNWTRGLQASISSGMPMIDELPTKVVRPVKIIVEPQYFLRHPLSGEERPWNPTKLIESSAAQPPADKGGSSE